MAENMKVNGRITIWKVLAFTYGTMAENTKDNIEMIRNTVMVFILGLMADAMKGVGGKVNSMALELTLFLKRIS